MLPFFFLFIALLCILIIILDLIFLLPTVHGAIYIPTTTDRVKKMLKLAAIKPGDKIADLGSGDGRILIAAAQLGAEAHGYEINPILVLHSLRNIRRAGLQHKAHVHWRTLWWVNTSQFDTIFVFGIFYIMKDLERKLRRELRPGAKVIVNSFPFPTWSSHTQPNNHDNELFLYQK